MDGRAPADNTLSRIVRLIETLDFADVRPSHEINVGGASIQAALAEDTRITVTAVSASEDNGDATWFSIHAIGGTDTSEALASKVASFEFSMPSGDAEILLDAG